MSSQFTILCVAAYYTYMYTFRVLLYSSNLLTNLFFSVSITKLGSDEVCNYESNEETSWGCTHTGNAAIWNPQNENYYSYNHEETIEVAVEIEVAECGPTGAEISQRQSHIGQGSGSVVEKQLTGFPEMTDQHVKIAVCVRIPERDRGRVRCSNG